MTLLGLIENIDHRQNADICNVVGKILKLLTLNPLCIVYESNFKSKDDSQSMTQTYIKTKREILENQVKIYAFECFTGIN